MRHIKTIHTRFFKSKSVPAQKSPAKSDFQTMKSINGSRESQWSTICRLVAKIPRQTIPNKAPNEYLTFAANIIWYSCYILNSSREHYNLLVYASSCDQLVVCLTATIFQMRTEVSIGSFSQHLAILIQPALRAGSKLFIRNGRTM